MIESYLDKDAVTHKKSNGFDQWNEPEATTDATIDARVIYETRLIRDRNGEQVVSSMQVIVEDQTIGHDDKITVDGTDYDILRIQKLKDFDTRFIKVYLK